jgi:hypothetical protein
MAKPAPAAAAGWPWRILIMWLVLAAVLLLVNAQGIVLERFGDPDDALRLVEVRDLLGGQSWFDVRSTGSCPEGVARYWSRLVDIPLATGILILRPPAWRPSRRTRHGGHGSADAALHARC